MLALAYVLVLAIVALGVPLGLSVADRVDAEVRSQARGEAEIVAAAATGLVSPPRRAQLTTLARRAARSSRGRVIVVDAHGRLLADSAGEAVRAQDFSGRPEIADALAGRSSERTRTSATLSQRLLATAVPLNVRGRPAGAVRVTQSVAAAHRAVRRQITEIALIALLVLLAGLAAGVLIAEQVARPLRRLEAAAREVAAGDLDALAPVEGSSEQRSLARSFNDMTARVAGVLRSQQEFVADASHQLRTPLTAMRLRLEEAHAKAAPEVAVELDAGMREVDRLARTVDELLVLSGAGEPRPPGQEVSPLTAARRAVERWGPYADDRGLTLALTEGEDLCAVWCVASDLDRALDVLLENALNYAPAGSEVTLEADGPGLAVLDRGPGLEADEAELVFKRFGRGRAGLQGSRGSGLGLPIARELMRRWNGDATISNRPGGGARAHLTLPRFAGSLPGRR